MESTMEINNKPEAQLLWAGIGGHFDSLGQIVNEFLDNCISNFIGHDNITRNIIVTLHELTKDGSVKISIEDSGTGMQDIDAAFTLGETSAAESPLNEHGFGLKHALASANPKNDAWEIFTRTKEDVDNKQFKKITSKYKIEDFTATICADEIWPGQLNGSGTLIKFTVSRSMFMTLTRGIQGGMTSFRSIADVLCEDIGFVYAGVIETNAASITMDIIDYTGNHLKRAVGAVKPDFEEYIQPGEGSEQVDLGCGTVTLEYKFGKMKEKAKREEFDNSTARKYYKKNMSSSGVEIRINGRVLCYNLFKEIWSIEKHNSYNYLLVSVNVKSSDKDALPKTRTSKNGLREGDVRLDALYSWIRGKMSMPKRDVSLSDHETDLFLELRDQKMKFDPNPNKIIDVEKYVFAATGNQKDKVRIDLFENTSTGISIYEGKKEETTSKDVYQLRMYWDGLVYDGVKPDVGYLVATTHPDSVKNMVSIVNSMKDASGNNYNLVVKTWSDVGITITK